jgi:hypothetical protein
MKVMKSKLFGRNLLCGLMLCLAFFTEANAQDKPNASTDKTKSKKGGDEKVAKMSDDSLLYYVKATYLQIQKDSQKSKENDQKVVQLEGEVKNFRDTISKKNNEIKVLKQQLSQQDKDISLANASVEAAKKNGELQAEQRNKTEWNNLIAATLKGAVMVQSELVQKMKSNGSSDYLFQLTEFGNQSELLSRVTNFMDNGIGSSSTFSEDYKQLKKGINQEFVAQANYYKALMSRLKHFETAAKDLDGILSEIRGNKEPKVRKSFLDLYTYSSALDAYPYLKKKYDANYTKDDPLGLTF